VDKVRILDILDRAKIFSIKLTEDNLRAIVTEGGNELYQCDLFKDEMYILAREIRSIADSMED
jgi:hypothetical protein